MILGGGWGWGIVMLGRDGEYARTPQSPGSDWKGLSVGAARALAWKREMAARVRMRMVR